MWNAKSLYAAVVVASAILALRSATTCDGLRILGIFPVNSRSHFAMSETLMKGLAERGHQVDVYSHFPLKDPPANYTDFLLEGHALARLMNGEITYKSLIKDRAATSTWSYVAEYGQLGLPICNLLKLPTLRRLVRTPPRNPPYDLVIVEPFVANCYLAWGRYLNVPLIAVSPSNLIDSVHESLRNPFNPAVHPSYFSTSAAPTNFYGRLENVVISLISAISFNQFIAQQDSVVREIFGPGYPPVQELYKDVSLMLINYNPQLNGIRPFVASVVPVGGLHVVDSNETLPEKVQEFLDKSSSGFIFMSFGTKIDLTTFPKSMLEAFYEAFKKIAPVRVLMKIANPRDLPDGLPSNVIAHHWLPQIKVLKHKNIRAFITHGDLMGTQEAIHFGVPMIGIPLYADQLFNINSYEQKYIAIKLNLDNITEDTLSIALNKILRNPLYKNEAVKMSKLVKDLPQRPIDTAIFWIEYIHRNGKNTLAPPDLNMQWWQIASLDVFLVLSVTVVLTPLMIIYLSWVLFHSCKNTIRKIRMKLKRD